jgi:hypothetical protein
MRLMTVAAVAAIGALREPADERTRRFLRRITEAGRL